MLPATDKYLLYAYIDEGMRPNERSGHYSRLGRYVREMGRKMSYHSHTRRDVLGIHYNCYLGGDPMVAEYAALIPEEIRATLLADTDVNILTGVFHSAWRYTTSREYAPGRSSLRARSTVERREMGRLA